MGTGRWWGFLMLITILAGARVQAASLALVGKVPVRAHIEVRQDPLTGKWLVTKFGDAEVKVQTAARGPASVVRVIAP
jgi:hypothetical protein